MPPRLASEAPTLLREVLKRNNISQSALARALGCDRRQVRAWVTGEHTPTPGRREEIACAVGVSEAELWPDADSSQKAAA